ncbi:ABC transporter permease [Ectothiorhodospira shaposhnikovii]|uniref:ABC transporter permease n=1 Tax=Ectothiorhodospira shaposhnikovii TaxID=1054 RepID=UPI001903531D|nr:ABC transporter permease [Ectothiorhodospira shaposhnikovii]MBK1673019.1 ABC transporter permease [Ectothiorhodospira shaposhnikovii]
MTNAHSNWIAFKTIIIKEVLRFSRIWIQTILPPMITMGLYFVIFGGLIGARIGEMDGIRYMDFIIPGLIMMAVITNAYANVVSSFYSSKFQRHLEEMLVSPVPNYLIILGFMGGGICRGLAVGVAVTLVSLFFSPLSIHNPAVALSVVVLTAALFSLAGLINGVFARSFDDISIIPTFILTPLTYLGGVFYSITLLPEFWQGVSMFNPILYMVNAFRYGFLGVTDFSLWLSYGIIIGFILALYGIALYLLNKGIGIRQ